MLPQQREEARASAEAVVGIAGEVAAEQFFLVEEAKHKKGNDEEETGQRPPRAQRQRREGEHENRAEVHGMPDEAIGSGRDHSVSFLDLDGAGGKAVFLHDPKGDERSGEDEDLGKNCQPKRDAGPAEAVIQAGDEQGRKGQPLDPANDGLLLADRFLGSQAALHELGIALQEIY